MTMREIGFVIMTLLAAAILVFAAISYGQASEQQRFYDARGNSVGTASTDSQGTTTFRDAHGNTVGKRTRR